MQSNPTNGTNLFQEIKPKKLSDEIFEQIKSLIIQRKLPPGAKLPPERKLANAFNVGRPCLREALNKLSAVGLIEARKKNGYYVRSLTEELIGPLKTFIESEINNLIDFIEVRRLLDIWGVKQAIKTGSDQDLEKIKTALEKGDNVEFHVAIAEATHNVIFYHVISNMHSLLSGISIIKQRRLDHNNLFAKQHYEIYQAIKNRDTRAAELSVSRHIDSLIGKNEVDQT